MMQQPCTLPRIHFNMCTDNVYSICWTHVQVGPRDAAFAVLLRNLDEAPAELRQRLPKVCEMTTACFFIVRSPPKLSRSRQLDQGRIKVINAAAQAV